MRSDHLQRHSNTHKDLLSLPEEEMKEERGVKRQRIVEIEDEGLIIPKEVTSEKTLDKETIRKEMVEENQQYIAKIELGKMIASIIDEENIYEQSLSKEKQEALLLFRRRDMKLCPMVDFSFSSYIRGKHAYKFWRPVVDTILTCQREEENKYDPSAVSVIFENRVAGHVPKEISHILTEFLHGGGSIDAKITGKIVNRGYGLEVPVDYLFIGCKTDIRKVKESLEA